MPSPEAGGVHHTEGLKGPAQHDFDPDVLVRDFSLVAEVSGEQHDHLTQRASQDTHSQPPSQPSILHEVHRTCTVPLKDDDAPRKHIERPRSSGKPASQGFQWSKAQPAQMDMSRRIGPKTQVNDAHERYAATEQGNSVPLVDDANINVTARDRPGYEEAGMEHSKDATSEKPLEAPSETHRAHLNSLPSQTDHTADPSLDAARADHSNARDNSTSCQQTFHIQSEQIPFPALVGREQTQGKQTKHVRPPTATAGRQEKFGPNKFLSGSHTQHVVAPLSNATGKNTKRIPREQQHSADPLGCEMWEASESTSVPSAISGTAISEVRSRPPHPRVKALAQQGGRGMAEGNTYQQRPEQDEHAMDACIQGQSYVVPERSCYMQDHHQGSPSIKKQSLGNVPSRKGPSDPKTDSTKEGQLHSLNTQAAPARITKAGAGTKQARVTKATKGTGRPGEPIKPSGAGLDIHSSHVLNIWQKLFEKEQRDLTAKEVARRESCEAEVARLRSAEQEHDAALKAAKKAKLNASTKLQQLQSANNELNKRIRELEACLSDTSHEVKELQRDKKIAATACSKAEKKIEMLEADKKSLAISHDDAQQKVLQELSATKIKLTEMQKDLEDANQLIGRLNAEASQKGHDLEEQKDRVAQLLRDNEETLAKYNDIDGEISKLGPSLEKPLAELTHSVKELLEQQATKDSVEDVAQRIGNLPSLLSNEHVDFSNLQVTLQSLNDSVQTKFDDLKQSTKSSSQDDSAFEQRLMTRLQEEFRSFASSQENLLEAQNMKAALEERCNTLRHSESELQRKLDAAAGTQEASQRSLVAVQTELSCLKSSLTVDSTRLQQLEISKAAVDQELRNALARIHEEEQKRRALSEVELGLRQEVMELKVSQLIETAQEEARLYYAKHSRDVVEGANAKHANELRAEQEKTRQSGETLRFQSAQIASLKEQICRKSSELQSLKDSVPAENATIDDLQRQLDVAKSENAKIRDLREAENDEKLKELQQQLSGVQTQKQEIDLKCQQLQQDNDTVQEQLEATNNELAMIHRQLEETQTLLKESEQEAARQKSDAEEMLLQREEQWAAEVDGIRSQLQESNAQLQENEASHQLHCEEYEEQLRSQVPTSENNEPGKDDEMTQQLRHPTEDVSRPPASVSPNALRSPVPETMVPAANSRSIRKPRRKLDRSNKSVSHSVARTQPEESQPLHNPTDDSQGHTQPGIQGSRTQVSHRSSDGSTFGEDFWVSQELGKHEKLTEQGVDLLQSQGEMEVEIPETLQDSLRKPKLFSEFAREQEDIQENDATSSLSSAQSSNLDIPEGLAALHLQQEDRAEATPTPEGRGTDGTARQTYASMENPFFEEERPVSRANMSRRLETSYQLRQESYQSGSGVAEASLPRTPLHPPHGTERAESGECSSPLFMEPPKPKNNVTYSHRQTTQSTKAEQDSHSTPSGALKRPNSGDYDEPSSKRVKGTSNKYRSSPIMTRATSRAGPRSQVAESQSQDLRVRFPEEPSQVSANAGSQPQSAPQKPSQPQSQQPTRVPSMSRMKTSEGSSSGGTRNATPKKARRRKTDEIGGRFDQEIKSL
ncbi:hypothetical protein SLS58_004060 [Diplodia intermedia]|uniref:Uncharacterized protein n=1 Tax=Diplodia intermedia TaxID=856260 RepID=A0ABR3TUW0_9PEZI